MQYYQQIELRTFSVIQVSRTVQDGLRPHITTILT